MFIAIVFFLLLLSVVVNPHWDHSRDLGHGPSGALFALALVLLIVFLVTGRI